jgi:hypothetical protein
MGNFYVTNIFGIFVTICRETIKRAIVTKGLGFGEGMNR